MMSQDEWAIRSKWLSEDNAHEDEQYQRYLEETDKDARIADLERQLAEARGALTAIEKLAIHASIASCTCHTKTPDITFHSGDCRYVLLQYIIAQCEDARTLSALKGTP